MATVKVDLLVNIKEAVDAIKGFSSDASKSLSTIKFASVTTALLEVGKTALEVGEKLVHAFEAPIEAAAQQEEAIHALNVALAQNANFTDAASKSLQDFATNIQSTTKYSDEAVLSNIALLESISGLDENGLKQGAQAAIDMAAALKIDLNKAFELVAKAAEGEVSAFKKRGIEIQKGIDDNETFANTLQVLSKFQGAAAAEVNTFEGALKLSKNAFGEVLEALGDLVIKNPIIITGLKELGIAFLKVAEVIRSNAPIFQSVIDAVFRGLVSTIPVLIEVLGGLDTAVVSVAKGFLTLKGGVLSIVGFLSELTAGSEEAKNAIADSVAADIGAIEKQKEGLDETAAKRKEAIGQIKKISDEFVTSVNKTTEAQTHSSESNINGLDRETRKMRELIQTQDERIKGIQQTNALFGLITASPEIRVKLAEFSAEIQKGMTEFQKGLVVAGAQLLGSVTKGAQGAKDLISGAAGAFAETFLKGLGGPVKDIVALLQEGPDKVRKMFDEFFKQLPKSLRNILDSIPVVLETVLANLGPIIIEILDILAERLPDIIVESIDAFVNGVIENLIPRLPEIIQKIIELAPSIAVALGNSLSFQAPIIAVRFADAMIAEAPRIASAIINSFAKESLGGSGGVGGISAGGFSLPSLPHFASGGDIPQTSASQSDNFVAALGAGESVLQSDTNAQLKRFLASQGGGQQLTVNLMIGEEQLANAILNLNRQGFRLA